MLTVVIFIGLLSGCANVSKMPLQESATSVDLSSKTILVGKVNIKNENTKSWQPDLHSIFLKRDGKKYSYIKPTRTSKTPNVGKEFLFSLASEPGNAELNFMRFFSRSLLINGTGEIQFKQELNFPESGIAYIGNIDATIVARQPGEPRAGSVVPLIDQAVTGFSNGTFVVKVTDNYEEDIQLILEKYPYLKDQEIKKMILPEWEYPSK